MWNVEIIASLLAWSIRETKGRARWETVTHREITQKGESTISISSNRTIITRPSDQIIHSLRGWKDNLVRLRPGSLDLAPIRRAVHVTLTHAPDPIAISRGIIRPPGLDLAVRTDLSWNLIFRNTRVNALPSFLYLDRIYSSSGNNLTSSGSDRFGYSLTDH